MANLSTKSKVLSASRTTVGRDYFNLPDVPSVIALFIEVVSGTATIDVEISDDNPITDIDPTFIPIKSVTETSLVLISIPAAVIATNVTAISGEVHTSYRMTVGSDYLSIPIQSFSESTLEGSPLAISGTVTTSTPGSTVRLYGPAVPGITAATIYTVPTGDSARMTSIHAVNTTGTAATLTMSIGTDATTNRILSAKSIAANDYLHLETDFVLASTEIIQASQGTASAIVLTLSGGII